MYSSYGCAGFFISRGYEEILFPKLKNKIMLQIKDLSIHYVGKDYVVKAVEMFRLIY